MVIHNQSNTPYFNSERILIPVGAETDVKIVRNFVSKLGGVYSLCVNTNADLSATAVTNFAFNHEFYDYINKTLGLLYTQQYCFALCLQKQVITKCGCASVW